MSIVINSQGQFDSSDSFDFTDIDSSIDPAALDELLDAPAIRIVFSGCAAGRFLTLGRQLRLRGFEGHIRAAGSLVPDQFPMALKVGIDSAEISDAHAERCTQEQWAAHAARAEGGYQRRLAG